MVETVTGEAASPTLISVDDAKPNDEGGPIARAGFQYQDEVAVGFLIEMLEEPSLLKVHCETHDDVLLVRVSDGVTRLAEFVQVKASEPDKLWSVADLCARKNGKPGTSLFETSLARDRHLEESRFRLVTLRPVVSDLEPLTFPRGGHGRSIDEPRVKALRSDIDGRHPGVLSEKGHGVDYWLDHCLWDQRHSEESVRRDNLLRLLRLSAGEGRGFLPEQAEVLLDELRRRAKAAGDARWEPDRGEKIILREALREWWERRTRELLEGAASPSGGKLRAKMAEAGLPSDVTQLAVELRLDYAAAARTTQYMEPDERMRLQQRVKSELMSLRARQIAGRLNLDSVSFHALCLDRLDAVCAERPAGAEDRSAFLKGCMYDIVDRCLHRFATTG